jgi:hypothetical protein
MTDADWGAFSASALEALRFSSTTKADVDWEDLLVSEDFIIDEPDGKMTELLGIQPAAIVVVAEESSTASGYGLVHDGADIHLVVYMAKETDHSDDDHPADDICPWNLSYRTTYDARQQTSDLLRSGDDNWHMLDLHAQTEFFFNEDGILDDVGPWDPGYALGVPGDPPDDITVVDPTTLPADHDLAVAIASSRCFSHMNQFRHLLGSNLAPSAAVSSTNGFTIDVVLRQVHERYDRPSVPPPPRPPMPIGPAPYLLLGDIMHYIFDANGATGSSIMSVLLAAPRYMALVHCTVHCTFSAVYAGIAPPIGEVVDSYDRRINTSNIAVSAYYIVTNHSAEDDAHSSIMGYDCHFNMASHDYWRWVIVGLYHEQSQCGHQ